MEKMSIVFGGKTVPHNRAPTRREVNTTRRSIGGSITIHTDHTPVHALCRWICIKSHHPPPAVYFTTTFKESAYPPIPNQTRGTIKSPCCDFHRLWFLVRQVSATTNRRKDELFGGTSCFVSRDVCPRSSRLSSALAFGTSCCHQKTADTLSSAGD